jgi:2C-methyl-D-erythritol 2,4-cyclodiphosphate synthase
MMQKVSKNYEKAFSLFETSKITFTRLKKFNSLEFPKNSLIDYYTVIHSLCEAFASVKGYKFRGEYAHKDLIDFVLKDYKSLKLIQEIRNLRNKANYEGNQISKEYIEINEKEIKETIYYLQKKINYYLRNL